MAKKSKDILLGELQQLVPLETYQQLLNQAGDEDKLYRIITQARISSFSTAAARRVSWHEIAAVLMLVLIAIFLLYLAYGVSNSARDSIVTFWGWLQGHF
jgi:hypothetical protein